MSDQVIVDFRHIRLEPAINGWILEFTKVTEKPGTMDSRDHHHKQMIFKDEEIDLAIAKMKEMLIFKKDRKANPGMSAPSIDISVTSS